MLQKQQNNNNSFETSLEFSVNAINDTEKVDALVGIYSPVRPL